jgi:uncharacterized membrane protein
LAEAVIAAFTATIGITISLAIVCFVLRSRVHANGSHNHNYDKVTTGSLHVHVDK